MQLTRRNFILFSGMAGLGACSVSGGTNQSGAAASAPETASAPAPAPAAGPVRTVAVELFTSQGCSSCPPADAVLARLAREPHVVALSRPVTYWDRLGWPDTFGRPDHDVLQKQYNARFGTGRFYTPQAVVQGQAELVGSLEQELRARVAEAQRRPGPVVRAAEGAVLLTGDAPRRAEIRLLALKGEAEVAIGRGENGGRKVRYTNVVLGERSLGAWRGGEARVEVPAAALKVSGADRYAVVVQEQGGGPILAATYL